MINALTIDVEDYFHVEAFARVISPNDWEKFPRRVEKNTYQLLEHLARNDVRATFFILGWVAARCPGLVRDIATEGHEIGSHGYSHRMISKLSVKDFRSDVWRSKSLLEDQTGSMVRCYRAPSYSITAKTLWALDILRDAGVEYDSSIYPIHHDLYGIPDAPRFPHFRNLSEGGRILEFPPSTIKVPALNIPIGGGGYFRCLPYSVTASAIRYLNSREKQPALLYFHPWEIDPEQPRIAASWRSRLRHYQNLHTTEAKLERLLAEFSWAPMTEVLRSRLEEASLKSEVDDGL